VTAKSDSTSQLLTQKQAEYEAKLSTAISVMDQCVALMPWDWRPRMLRHELLIGNGLLEKAAEGVQQALLVDPANQNFIKMDAQVKSMRQKESSPVVPAAATTPQALN
jgi:hypothetical protein